MATVKAMDFKTAAEEFVRLNNGVKIEKRCNTGSFQFDSCLITSVSPRELKYPQGCGYSMGCFVIKGVFGAIQMKHPEEWLWGGIV